MMKTQFTFEQARQAQHACFDVLNQRRQFQEIETSKANIKNIIGTARLEEAEQIDNMSNLLYFDDDELIAYSVVIVGDRANILKMIDRS